MFRHLFKFFPLLKTHFNWCIFTLICLLIFPYFIFIHFENFFNFNTFLFSLFSFFFNFIIFYSSLFISIFKLVFTLFDLKNNFY